MQMLVSKNKVIKIHYFNHGQNETTSLNKVGKTILSCLKETRVT